MNHFPSLWRRDRRDPLCDFQREVDRFFGREEDLPALSMMTPACDIEETDTQYLVSMDLPGLTKNDVKVELSENLLRVSGERKEEHREGKKSSPRTERYYGSFERSITLPANVRADQVEARFEHGVLKIALPKAETNPTRQIPVTEGKAA